MTARGPADGPVFVQDIHLDLSKALDHVPVPHGYRSALGIVRLHGTPLGTLAFPVANGLIPSHVVAAAVVDELAEPILRHLLSDRLQATGLASVDEDPALLLGVAHTSFTGAWPTVTAAVCTSGRLDDLRRCLAALAEVDYPSIDFLVVDNAPTQSAVAELIRTHHPRVRYVAEPRPGLDWARNRAIREATGDILAFTDDDAVADPGWLKALVAPLADNADVMVTAGLVLPYELETDAQQLFERHGGLGRGFVPRWIRTPIGVKTMHAVNVTTVGTGANMAFRRIVFDDVGEFDPALDAGTASAAGGDTEMFFRLLKKGHTFVYEPDAIVRHRHRRDLAAIRSQLHNWLKGAYAAAERTAESYSDERWPLVAFASRLMLLYFPRRIATAVFGSTVNLDLVLCELRGLLAGRGTYAAACRDAAEIAERFGPQPSGATAPSVARPRQKGAPSRPARRVIVDVDQPLPPVLPGPNDADRVYVDVMRSARAIGTVEIVSGGAPIRRRRLGDEIVSTYLRELVDARRFRRALQAALAP